MSTTLDAYVRVSDRGSTLVRELALAAAGLLVQVLTGSCSTPSRRGIDWEDIEIALPAFLTIALMPFTYSIFVGIGAGFVT